MPFGFIHVSKNKEIESATIMVRENFGVHRISTY